MDAVQEAHWREKGWIVVPRVLSEETVAAMNEIYETQLAGTAANMHPEDRGWDGAGLVHRWYNSGQQRPEEERFGRPRRLWGAPFYDAITPPRLLPIIDQLLGDPAFNHCRPEAALPPGDAPRFRMDHENIHFAAPFDPGRGGAQADEEIDWDKELDPDNCMGVWTCAPPAGELACVSIVDADRAAAGAGMRGSSTVACMVETPASPAWSLCSTSSLPWKMAAAAR